MMLLAFGLAGVGRDSIPVLHVCWVFSPLILSGHSFWALVIPCVHVLTSTLLHTVQFSRVVSLCSFLFLLSFLCLSFFGLCFISSTHGVCELCQGPLFVL